MEVTAASEITEDAEKKRLVNGDSVGLNHIGPSVEGSNNSEYTEVYSNGDKV